MTTFGDLRVGERFIEPRSGAIYEKTDDTHARHIDPWLPWADKVRLTFCPEKTIVSSHVMTSFSLLAPGEQFIDETGRTFVKVDEYRARLMDATTQCVLDFYGEEQVKRVTTP